MGCDIHFYVERRITTGNPKWVTCDKWTEEDGEKHVDFHDSFYHERNYDLFAILANVRNGWGFAGEETGEGFNPISALRGVPTDICPEYREATKHYGGDGHSHSWLTVQELMDYDWTQTTTKRGMVHLSQWARWKLYGAPEAWSGGVGGGGVVKTSLSRVQAAWESMGAAESDIYDLIHQRDPIFSTLTRALGGNPDAGAFDGRGNVYTEVSWEIPYYRAGRYFLSEVLPRLWRLGNPRDVRICFFFDN